MYPVFPELRYDASYFVQVDLYMISAPARPRLGVTPRLSTSYQSENPRGVMANLACTGEAEYYL